jgi:hypothetical protein
MSGNSSGDEANLVVFELSKAVKEETARILNN